MPAVPVRLQGGHFAWMAVLEELQTVMPEKVIHHTVELDFQGTRIIQLLKSRE